MTIAALSEPMPPRLKLGDSLIDKRTVDEPCAERSAVTPGSGHNDRRRHHDNGFTLIELLIVLTITGVLSSIAFPSFQSYLQKARRADVMVSMMQIQLSQLRWRANSTGYGSLADIGVASVSTGGHYTLQLNSSSPDRYEVVAVATGSQARDSNCRYMKFSMVEANVLRTSGSDESVANNVDSNRRCWNQ